MVKGSSSIKGFKDLSPEQRLAEVARLADLDKEEVDLLRRESPLPLKDASRIIENVITTLEIPLGIATNFLINGKDYLIPMAVEESSIVAACSYAAKLARNSGGFRASASDPMMIGQIQLINVSDIPGTREKILANKDRILLEANTKSRTLRESGAGAMNLVIREFPEESMVIVHLIVNVMDAMGANVVNTMCEHVSPIIEEITGNEANLRILSNLTDLRTASASAVFMKEDIGGEEAVRRIMQAYRFAMIDPYRAATHNKGILNGIDAVILATMNDWRAIEAGAHSYASVNGYHSLTNYRVDENGNLEVSIKLPLAVGTVGGATSSIPKAKIVKKILGVKDSGEFAGVLASVGLAQNFAAVRALSVEGIQKGHMALHSKNVAVSAGAKDSEIDEIARIMVSEGNISVSHASELLSRLKERK
ncbi:MAG: hydroxymethylglutaryl-CoA reductase, degradative [Candidatus Thermoplasmatota archaeon]|nr:hydroxymethylglutaryl-CoA reductase, degradative [Candidatus Thermoplasmatota archaeon]MCL5438234.1 hydroxymethylglutaryl-CoA reductase, degradative [Candidatus Thermoplasmatota archaeon]